MEGVTHTLRRVCTFNLRLDTPWDGKNRFRYRRPLIRRTLKKEGFDVIGFQEVLPSMRRWLDKTLKRYTLVGVGRGGALDDEQNPVAFRTDIFDLIGHDTFWLSPTPCVPGSRFAEDQSPCPRICTAVLLRDKTSDNLLRVYNTHLDHVGERAREQGLRVLLARIAWDETRYPGVPILLMGDFNATPDTPLLSMVTSLTVTPPLRDVSGRVEATFHGYNPLAGGSKIDYLFTNALCDESQTHIVQMSHFSRCLSDHHPLTAAIRV